MEPTALSYRRWVDWAKFLALATIRFFSAAFSALLLIMLGFGNPDCMWAWFAAATSMMFICYVGAKFCNLKLKDLVKGSDPE